MSTATSSAMATVAVAGLADRLHRVRRSPVYLKARGRPQSSFWPHSTRIRKAAREVVAPVVVAPVVGAPEAAVPAVAEPGEAPVVAVARALARVQAPAALL